MVGVSNRFRSTTHVVPAKRFGHPAAKEIAMLEVRQGRRSCALTFKEFRIADCAECLVDDLWFSTTKLDSFEINGATFTQTKGGLLMDPGMNTCVVKPHRNLKVYWGGQILFVKGDDGRISFELTHTTSLQAG
jgi:hypothetical protein